MKRILLVIIYLIFSTEFIAEAITLETKHRRRYDEIHVEIWMKSSDSYSPFLSSSKLVLNFDTNSLIALNQIENTTDSISDNIDQVNPIIDIISPINSSKGLSFPQILSLDNDKGEIVFGFNRINSSLQGIKLDKEGLGTFITKLKFKIKDSVSNASNTGILWNADSTLIFDDQNRDISTYLSFISDPNFKVIGITLLSPTQENSIIDRDKNYLCLTSSYSGKGYPLFFERSINPSIYKIPTPQKPQIDNNLAYSLEINIGDGNWFDFGRFVESDFQSSGVLNNNLHYVGNISNPNTTTSYITTSQKGSKLTIDNFRLPIRFLITKELSYKIRYDKLYLRLRKLDGEFGTNLSNWNIDSVSTNIYGPMISGRFFFLHLNGTDEYLKTDNNISNSTQLTVEAWVNLNLLKQNDSNPGIVVSSAGEDATPINGSTEGAWMLYLKNGRYPAFRVREIESRGRNGYLADLSADFPINNIPEDSLYKYNYELNWNHIAATVNNNEVTLYVNGIIVDKFINDSAIDSRMLVTNHPIWLGLNPNNKIDPKNYFGGGIKAVRLWKVALTQEEVKKYSMGIHEPTNTQQFDDIRRGLILYYSLNGEINDIANETNYQQGNQKISFYKNRQIKTLGYNYKPDFPHIKLTSPIKNAGFSNIENSHYEISWIAYEIGDIGKVNSKDVELEYSLDGGISWIGLKDTLNKYQVGTNAPDIEKLFILWEPYLNNDINANLRTIDPFTKKVLVRISGTTANLQKDAYYISDTITIAPYFSIYKGVNTVIKTAASNTINFTGNRNMLELWIKPYRFASASNNALPLISKVDSVSGKEYFSLKLLHNGLLEFSILDNKDSLRIAKSDPSFPIIEANSIALDSPWTHIAVYFDYSNNGNSFIRFYIDGFPQNDSSITQQLGPAFVPKSSNKVHTYFCSYPNVKTIKLGQYYGEFKEFRFWNDLPASIDFYNDLDDLTLFVQGSLSNRVYNLSTDIKKNLKSAISLNGGTGVSNEIRILTSDYSPEFYLKFHNDSTIYYPTKPYIKVVEPIYRQRVSNKSEELRLRWVGFDYSSLTSDISLGSISNPPAIEYSLFGGGGDETQPYKFVGSPYWSGNKITSLSIPSEQLFKFYGSKDSIVYALNLNVSQANPDKNNDGKYTDQGALPATLTNARFRLSLKYRIFNATDKITSESSLFTINPGSNFTIRLIPEGYYDGRSVLLRQIGNSFENGGIKIKIFEDNDGTIGKLIDSAESFFQFTDLNFKNMNAGNFKFANIDYVFENLNKSSYWILAQHRNHLPVLSRFAAPYVFEGDNPDTWKIESGWDFTSWNGVKNNYLPQANSDPWLGRYFTAYGNASSLLDDSLMFTTSLKFSNGLFGEVGAGLSLMIAGDVNQDNKIDDLDYNSIRKSEGTYNSKNDLTGDKYVNADDRILVKNNLSREIGFDTTGIPLKIKIDKIPEKLNSDLIDELLQSSNPSAKIYLDYEIKNQALLVNISLEAIGSPFYLGSSTIALTYDTTVIKYRAFSTTTEVPYNKPLNGYLPIRSAPELINQDGIKNLRTIEIEYDKSSGKPGSLLENKKTYIGSFRFDILKNKTIMMKWHESTTLNTSEVKLNPDYILRDSIKPYYQYSMNFISPNGGEEYRPKTPIEIRWSFTGSSLINLEYSYNFGFNWVKINSTPIAVTDGKYSWSAPSTYSTTYLIRATDYDSGQQVEISDSAFSVVSGFAYFLKPASNDEVYMGGTKSQIFWASGGLTNISLLFSSNSGDKWTVISNKVDATRSEIMWTIPKVNTRTALIRMVDNLTKDTIIDSDMFKILSGRVIFHRPGPSEKVYINREYSIRWANEGADTFDLQLSYDNGDNWEYLKVNVPARDQIYRWMVPNKESDFAIVRAIWKGDENLEYGRSDSFIITTLNSISPSELSELGISIYPNPVDDYLIISNQSDLTFNSIRILDINGKEIISSFINSNIQTIDLRSLDSGFYILELIKNNETIQIKLLKN